MRRREFITLLGGGAAAAWPMAAGGAAGNAGGWGAISAVDREPLTMAGFRDGLKEQGFVEGRNFTAEYRWAGRPISAASGPSGRIGPSSGVRDSRNRWQRLRPAAKAATATIPIVFTTGSDPVRTGLVASLARPGR